AAGRQLHDAGSASAPPASAAGAGSVPYSNAPLRRLPGGYGAEDHAAAAHVRRRDAPRPAADGICDGGTTRGGGTAALGAGGVSSCDSAALQPALSSMDYSDFLDSGLCVVVLHLGR